MQPLARYAPSLPFPPYAFLPGRDPHPTRDPSGHSFGVEAEPAQYFPPARWRENVPYLFGVDLYNHGYLWEAHEAWEDVWHPTKRDPVQADFLQGLIQCAAACLKIPMGQPAGLAKLSELGAAKLQRVARDGGALYMGLDVLAFAAAVRAFADSDPRDAGARPRIELAP